MNTLRIRSTFEQKTLTADLVDAEGQVLVALSIAKVDIHGVPKQADVLRAELVEMALAEEALISAASSVLGQQIPIDDAARALVADREAALAAQKQAEEEALALEYARTNADSAARTVVMQQAQLDKARSDAAAAQAEFDALGPELDKDAGLSQRDKAIRLGNAAANVNGANGFVSVMEARVASSIVAAQQATARLSKLGGDQVVAAVGGVKE